jgi:hypothetical protein
MTPLKIVCEKSNNVTHIIDSFKKYTTLSQQIQIKNSLIDWTLPFLSSETGELFLETSANTGLQQHILQPIIINGM